MKKAAILITSILLIACNQAVRCQKTINEVEFEKTHESIEMERVFFISMDLDNDLIYDTIFFDLKESLIVAKLSSQDFEPIKSQPIKANHIDIFATEAGFVFWESFRRGSVSSYFQYNSETNRIQLVRMSQEYFGNVVQDWSGESSVNLLTGEYTGNWNYFNHQQDSLISLPTIRTQMSFRTIYLEDFCVDTSWEFNQKCNRLHNAYRNKMLAELGRNPF